MPIPGHSPQAVPTHCWAWWLLQQGLSSQCQNLLTGSYLGHPMSSWTNFRLSLFLSQFLSSPSPFTVSDLHSVLKSPLPLLPLGPLSFTGNFLKKLPVFLFCLDVFFAEDLNQHRENHKEIVTTESHQF